MHKFVIAALGAVSATALGGAAYADASNWQIRTRAIAVIPDEGGTTDINGDIDIEDQYVPEFDITYFFTDNVAVELIAAVTPHDVGVNNTALDGADVDLGDVWLLPPTLTLQYHFTNSSKFKPYVGVGVNYTAFFDEDLPDDSGLVSIEYDDSFGYALQAGVDYAINNKWHINFDVKKVYINTDVTIDAGELGIVNADADIDPWIIGIGVGYRFGQNDTTS